MEEEHKKYSAEEVARHSSRSDIWVSIHGKVYDVSKFLNEHPGGEDVLLHVSARGDATQSFEDVGHSSNARTLMSKFLIGALEGYDPSKARDREGAGSARAKPLQNKPSSGLLDFILPLLFFGVAFLVWYFLNH